MNLDNIPIPRTDEEKMYLQQTMDMVHNSYAFRTDLLRKFTDPRRSIEDECGYPKGGAYPAENYKELYENFSLANRIVEVFPKECFEIQPSVYEDEDSEHVTPFEQSWDDLGKSLRGENSWYNDEEGNPVFEYLLRADILSGVGTYGVILLGIDDGRELDEPIEEFENDQEKEFYSQLKSESGIEEPDKHDPMQLMKGRTGTAEQYYVPLRNPNMDRYTKPKGKLGKKKPEDDEEVQTNIAPRIPSENDDEEIEEDVTEPIAEDTEPVSPEDTSTNPEATDESDRTGEEGMVSSDVEEFADQTTGEEQEVKTRRKLLYLRVFGETQCPITNYETDLASPRYGQPTYYNIQLFDPNVSTQGGIGSSAQTKKVHWSRIIHIADNLKSSEIFGLPRLKPVLPEVLDARKIKGAGAEGYWKSCFNGLSFETHPQLGGDVQINRVELKENAENYQNGLQKMLYSSGMTVKTLAPSVVDPTPHVNICIEAICIQLSIPVRVFKGSERGELASGQDDSAWNDRKRARQHNYLTPRLMVPFIDRLITIGVLAEPKGYSVYWPDLDSLGDKDKAMVATQKVQAFSAYQQGGLEALIPRMEFFTKVMGWDEEEAAAIVVAGEKRAEEMEAEEMLKQQEMIDQGLIADPTDPDQIAAANPAPNGFPPPQGEEGKPPFPPKEEGEQFPPKKSGFGKPAFGGGKPGGFNPAKRNGFVPH